MVVSTGILSVKEADCIIFYYNESYGSVVSISFFGLFIGYTY